MNSESNKPTAGRVAEHSFWPTERQYSDQRDTMGHGDLWAPDVMRRGATKLGDILTPERIKVPLVGTTRMEVVEELVDLLVDIGDLSDRDELLAAILSREQTRSTGIGSGLAIPHAKTSQVSDVIMAVGVCAEAIDFDSIDGLGVRLVAMLIGPEEMKPQHIRLLTRVTSMMSFASVRRKLLDAESADVLYKVICRYEATAP
ncbi:MAG: PTS sugar transporter subunit IIA [Phycisphaerae bacterium]|nr:PTS sugar transporter subunit IIA [Phycisphaerae bacterium]